MGGTTIPTKMLQSRLPILWRLRGNLEIVEFPNQFYLFKFGHDQDMALVRLGSPWTVAGHLLILTRWVPDFDPTKVYIATLPIWVSMPGLPFEYWVEDQIRKMVAPVGQFVKIDEVTRAQGRHTTKAKAARALMEINPSKPTIKGIFLKSASGHKFQELHYENLPKNYEICGKIPMVAPCNCNIRGPTTVITANDANKHQNATRYLDREEAESNTEW
ncbi:hypothetical protein AAC387_Pa09g0802 [Persea americana]